MRREQRDSIGSISQKVLALLRRQQVVIDEIDHGGHFVLTSGHHTDIYVLKDRLYVDPWVVHLVGQLVADAVTQLEFSPDVVVGPALGGIVLAQFTALHLAQRDDRSVLSVYAEKDGHDCFSLRRGYSEVVQGRKCLLVEDIITTGGSVRAVRAAIEAAGGIVGATVCLVNRGEVTESGVGGGIFLPFVNMSLPSYNPRDCPSCRNGIPISETVGKGPNYTREPKSK